MQPLNKFVGFADYNLCSILFMKTAIVRIFAFCSLFFVGQFAWAQPNTGQKTQKTADSLTLRQDTIRMDTLQKTAEIEHPILYKAKDSMRFDVLRKIIYLYGQAEIQYGDLDLKAEFIEIDQTTNLVKARGSGKKDDKGKETGTPVFKNRGESYEANSIDYNFRTKKGVISGTSSKQGDGFIVSDRVKRNEEGTLYSARSIYTTCDLPHPHYGIRASRMKVMPNKVTASGPFLLEIGGVPTPLGFFFGMFPQVGKRTSGFVMPQYGESRDRGFFLSGGGLYLVLNEYVDLSILGEIYSKGGYGINTRSTYRKRYKYSGNFSFNYRQNTREVLGQLDPTINNDFQLNWTHTPESRGSSRFSASVSAMTNTFNRNNALLVNNFLQSSANSSVAYSKTFTGTPFTFGMNLRVMQNIVARTTTVSPDARLQMNSIFPFKKKNSTKKSLLSELSFSYSGEAKWELSNVINFLSPEGRALRDTVPFAPKSFNRLWRGSTMGMTHSIPIQTNMTIAKYIQLSLSASYREVWYPEQYRFEYVNNRLKTDTLRQFSRFNSYSASASITTRLFMTFFPKFFGIQAIRNTLSPSIGLSYVPDFSQDQFGFFQELVNPITNQVEKRAKIAGNQGAPSQGESGSISFSLSNVIEAKMRSKGDSAKTKGAKIQLVNLSLSTGYNMIAPQFKLAPISFSANTNIKRFSINLGGTLDPYYIELQSVDPKDPKNVTQIRRDEYAINRGQGLGTIQNMRLGVSTNLQPRANKPLKATETASADAIRYINANRHLYMDWDLPWSLAIQYNINYNKDGFRPSNLIQTLSFNGDVSITKKWKIAFGSGYDFKAEDFSYTHFNIARDLHCWTMSVMWIPFGPQQGYTFNIGVKSAILKDLRLEKRNNYFFR